MLYGISFIYGTAGTLYFDDIRLDGSPLQIMALVFFFSGLGFKLSLVPFHLWTADAYQGAPTTVTSYLSVISKGSAAFRADDHSNQGFRTDGAGVANDFCS